MAVGIVLVTYQLQGRILLKSLVPEQPMARPAALREKLVGRGTEDLAASSSALVTRHVSCVRFTCVLLWVKQCTLT